LFTDWPPPRRYRHRGALAPNAPLRAAAIAFGREVADATGAPTAVSSPPPAFNTRSPARYLWIMLPRSEQARLFQSMPRRKKDATKKARQKKTKKRQKKDKKQKKNKTKKGHPLSLGQKTKKGH
jgi:hypothetical protein